MKKNKYSTPLWVLATILAGMLSPMQSAVNGQLGHWLQDGNACAVTGTGPGGYRNTGNLCQPSPVAVRQCSDAGYSAINHRNSTVVLY